jgi:anthranilate synthase component 2
VELKLTAYTEQGEVMALKHRRYPIFGVQFHPESFLTTQGIEILQNFLHEGHFVFRPSTQEIEVAN